MIRTRYTNVMRLILASCLLTFALVLGACDTEEGGISDREGSGMAENAGQGEENEDNEESVGEAGEEAEGDEE